LAVAGIKKYVARESCTARTLIAVNCGANMNFDRLRYVAERADIGAQREALFAVEIPEVPGSFLNFCEVLGDRSVTEFNYRYGDLSTAQIFVGLALALGKSEREQLLAAIGAAGLTVRDMTDNEMAKLHVRYMVGGHARALNDERLFRFEFPERPGALRKFLQAIGTGWNISLFHYRNHGADQGRILVGLQVPADERLLFQRFLDTLGYPYCDESDHPAYRLLLRE
jgi:threonine dehydratase